MTNFEQFKDKFDKEYKDIYDFIYSFEDENKNPFNLELLANNDQEEHKRKRDFKLFRFR